MALINFNLKLQFCASASLGLPSPWIVYLFVIRTFIIKISH